MANTADLTKKTETELIEMLHQACDGNSGEILQGLREMGLKSGPKFKAALIRYIGQE